MKNLTLKMREIFGKNWYGELQWNSLNEQHIINKLLIKLHHEIDLELISTCDVHYPRPELWESRELYKRLGWLSSKSLNPLPKSVEEIGYELYPKNGDQVFESAKKYSNIANVDYDWAIVSESIEKTYEIAHSIIEDFLPERSIKLPTFIVSSDKSSEETFSQIVWDIFNSSKFANNTIYKERLSKELGVILKRGFAGYFLTMKAISDKAKKMQLVSSGRGCFLKDSKVKMADKSFKNIQDIKKGDSVISHDGSNNIILDLFKYSVSEEIIKIELEDGRIIQCTKEHKILTKNGWKEAEKLNENDEIVEI
ncbi:hypothetical protein M0R19_04000 [Candidatus Pacearchaeota archaeon]|nr:hypothetical protein [Candidatus Pacearchaeota archaeon]